MKKTVKSSVPKGKAPVRPLYEKKKPAASDPLKRKGGGPGTPTRRSR